MKTDTLGNKLPKYLTYSDKTLSYKISYPIDKYNNRNINISVKYRGIHNAFIEANTILEALSKDINADITSIRKDFKPTNLDKVMFKGMSFCSRTNEYVVKYKDMNKRFSSLFYGSDIEAYLEARMYWVSNIRPNMLEDGVLKNDDALDKIGNPKIKYISIDNKAYILNYPLKNGTLYKRKFNIIKRGISNAYNACKKELEFVKTKSK